MDFIDIERKARVPHRCYMCGCTIEAGTKYIYQFVPEYKSASCIHKECQKLLSYEGFYNKDDDGTSDDFFLNAILDYINEHHLSEDGKAFDDGWDGDNYHLVKMILKELEDKCHA
mgnify:FL=1